MNSEKDWAEVQFKVGRYAPYTFASEEEKKNFVPYKPETKKLVWNVFNEENHKIVLINIFEYNWVFLTELLYAKKHYKDDFNKFAEHVRSWLQHEYWSRAEYETVITSWPPYIDGEALDNAIKERDEHIQRCGKFYVTDIALKVGFKIDVYTQVMMNWDRFIEYVWNNKHLITKKKLGLDR